MIRNTEGREEQDIQRKFRQDVIKLLGVIFMALIGIFCLVAMVYHNLNRLESLEREDFREVVMSKY